MLRTWLVASVVLRPGVGDTVSVVQCCTASASVVLHLLYQSVVLTGRLWYCQLKPMYQALMDKYGIGGKLRW
eukprot:3827819-Rhodomonas_salina.1